MAQRSLRCLLHFGEFVQPCPEQRNAVQGVALKYEPFLYNILYTIYVNFRLHKRKSSLSPSFGRQQSVCNCRHVTSCTDILSPPTKPQGSSPYSIGRHTVPLPKPDVSQYTPSRPVSFCTTLILYHFRPCPLCCLIRFSDQNFVCLSLIFPACYMSHLLYDPYLVALLIQGVPGGTCQTSGECSLR